MPHFQTSMEANENLKSLFRCINCQADCGFTKKLYCANCGTAQGRREMAIENERIKEENLVKGFRYAT